MLLCPDSQATDGMGEMALEWRDMGVLLRWMGSYIRCQGPRRSGRVSHTRQWLATVPAPMTNMVSGALS